ncbi:MAG: hypothetical protein LUQ05_01910, partial [Methanoregula sp.]|nr:hypothetical protein [Methanoregula sp.]
EVFLKAIERVLEEDPSLKKENRIDRVRNHTWSDRVDEMMRLTLNSTKVKFDHSRQISRMI